MVISLIHQENKFWKSLRVCVLALAWGVVELARACAVASLLGIDTGDGDLKMLGTQYSNTGMGLLKKLNEE